MNNPVLRHTYFKPSKQTTAHMTVQGAVFKTFVLLLLAATSASWAWQRILTTKNIEFIMSLLKVGAIGGFGLAVLTTFLPRWSVITAPLYALFEGVFLGAVSFLFETAYPGIILQALPLTFSLLLCMLFAYMTGLVKASQKLRMFIVMSLGAYILTLLVERLLAFAFQIELGLLQGSSLLSIGISVFLVIIGALSLIMDFDFIEKNAQRGVPRYMEWYSAFGLMVSLVWLYLRILDLLSKLQGRKRQ